MRPQQEIHVGSRAVDETQLPLLADGVMRVVWHSRFGDVLIEVRGGDTFVNGSRVVPASDVS